MKLATALLALSDTACPSLVFDAGSNFPPKAMASIVTAPPAFACEPAALLVCALVSRSYAEGAEILPRPASLLIASLADVNSPNESASSSHKSKQLSASSQRVPRQFPASVRSVSRQFPGSFFFRQKSEKKNKEAL